VSDDFDAPALQAAIDEIEGAGVPPHLVEQLRALAGPVRLPMPDSMKSERGLGGDYFVLQWRDGSMIVGRTVRAVELVDRWDYTIEIAGRLFEFSVSRPDRGDGG
jgi:hypothetical protein